MQFDDFFKNELLFQKGINYNDLPGWQKKGDGVYFKNAEREFSAIYSRDESDVNALTLSNIRLLSCRLRGIIGL